MEEGRARDAAQNASTPLKEALIHRKRSAENRWTQAEEFKSVRVICRSRVPI